MNPRTRNIIESIAIIAFLAVGLVLFCWAFMSMMAEQRPPKAELTISAKLTAIDSMWPKCSNRALDSMKGE